MTTAVKNVGRTVVEWDQDLGEEMADDRVAEIVGPMILISVAGERVLRPVVDAVPKAFVFGEDQTPPAGNFCD